MVSIYVENTVSVLDSTYIKQNCFTGQHDFDGTSNQLFQLSGCLQSISLQNVLGYVNLSSAAFHFPWAQIIMSTLLLKSHVFTSNTMEIIARICIFHT
jgi:hypothetical protein